MFASRPVLHVSCSLAVLLSLGLAGCASAPPVADKMGIAPVGTVSTFHRKSSGSLGAFDGPVVWTYERSTWQGKPVIAFKSSQGTSLHDPTSFGIVANLSPAGQPVASYEPPVDYRWPLEVGKSWSSTYQVTAYPTGRVMTMKVDSKVEAYEDVTVPAGTFKAFRLMWVYDNGEQETRWMSPAAGLPTIKRIVTRPASHPQGAGQLEAVLLSHKLPAP